MNDHRADVEMTCNDSSADEAPLIGRAGARHALLAPRVVLSREGECVQFNGSARVRLRVGGSPQHHVIVSAIVICLAASLCRRFGDIPNIVFVQLDAAASRKPSTRAKLYTSRQIRACLRAASDTRV
jgi:hypothetical protein